MEKSSSGTSQVSGSNKKLVAVAPKVVDAAGFCCCAPPKSSNAKPKSVAQKANIPSKPKYYNYESYRKNFDDGHKAN